MVVLADALVHLDFRRLDVVVQEDKSDGVAATLALEEEKSPEKLSNQAGGSTEPREMPRRVTTY
jgi:hypothetical protein